MDSEGEEGRFNIVSLSDIWTGLFYLIRNFFEISYYIKISPRDAGLAVGKFALRHRSRAKCVQAHTFLHAVNGDLRSICIFMNGDLRYTILVEVISIWLKLLLEEKYMMKWLNGK